MSPRNYASRKFKAGSWAMAVPNVAPGAPALPFRRRSPGIRSAASRLKSSAARFHTPRSRFPRLVFDALEPRLLLNADVLGIDLTNPLPHQQDHDLLVRMVEETRAVNEQ